MIVFDFTILLSMVGAYVFCNRIIFILDCLSASLLSGRLERGCLLILFYLELHFCKGRYVIHLDVSRLGFMFAWFFLVFTLNIMRLISFFF